MLGLGSRDEDGSGDVEDEAVKLLPAGDVLDGLAVQAAGDGVFVEGLLAGSKFSVGVGQEGDRGACRAWRRRSSASRVALSLRCGSATSRAVAAVSAWRIVISGV